MDRKESRCGYPSVVNNQHREMGQHYKYSWTEVVKYGGFQEPRCLAIESLGLR